MIIFDLDGTLADCEHRRHFVDPSYRDDCYHLDLTTLTRSKGWYYKDRFKMCEPSRAMKFEPDYKSFYEACDKDALIMPVAELYEKVWVESDYYDDICIWSGRCESVRRKTEKWLDLHQIRYFELKMRPIGNTEPDEVLKEGWLNEQCSDLMEAKIEGRNPSKHNIEFVFDDRPKVVRMWRRRGIFVFDCNQKGKEF